MANVPFENTLVPAQVGGDVVLASGVGDFEFTALTDTPSDYNFSEPRKFVIANSLTQQIQFKDLVASDVTDFTINAPADGQVLVYDSNTSKWVNEQNRVAGAIQTFTGVSGLNSWGNSPISIVIADNDAIVTLSTPTNSQEKDMLVAINNNIDGISRIIINALGGEAINGVNSFALDVQRFAVFVKIGNNWELAINTKFTGDLAAHSVTEMYDITSAGSGEIITVAERSKLNTITSHNDSIEITSNLEITSANIDQYNGVAIECKGTSLITVSLPRISTIPAVYTEFTITNHSSNDSVVSLIGNINDQGFTNPYLGNIYPGETVSVIKTASANQQWIVQSIVYDQKLVNINAGSAGAILIPINHRKMRIQYSTSTSFNQALPGVEDFEEGTSIIFVNNAASSDQTITFLPNAFDTIEGSANRVLYGGQSFELVPLPNDATWKIINYFTNRHLVVTDGTTTTTTSRSLLFDGNHFTVLQQSDHRAYVNFDGLSINTSEKANNIIFDNDDFSTSVVSNEATVTWDGLSIDGTQKTKDLTFNEFQFETNVTPNSANVNLRPTISESGPGYYASLSQNTRFSTDINISTTNDKIYFDYEIVNSGKIVTGDSTNRTYTIIPSANGTKTGYLLYVRLYFFGSAPTDGRWDLILKNASNDQILSDYNQNLIAVREVVKNGDKQMLVDVFAYIQIDQPLEFYILLQGTYPGATATLEGHADGNSCLVIQRVDEGFQTGDALQQAEIDLGLSFRYEFYKFANQIRTYRYILQRNVPEVYLDNTRKLYLGPWETMHSLSDQLFKIDSAGVNTRDNGTGLFCMWAMYFSAEEGQLMIGYDFHIVGEVLQRSQELNIATAVWGGTGTFNADIITGWNHLLPVPIITGSGWNVDYANRFRILEDPLGAGQTTPFSFDHIITVPDLPEPQDRFAIVIWTVPETTVALNHPQEITWKQLDFNADVPFSAVLLSPTEEADILHLSESDNYVEFSVIPINVKFREYTLNQAEQVMPIGEKTRGAADISVVSFNPLDATSINYLQFNAEGDATIDVQLNVYIGTFVSTGTTVNLNLQWKKFNTGTSSWQNIPGTSWSTSITKQDNDKYPYSIESDQFTIGVESGDELRLYASTTNDGDLYIGAADQSNYIIKYKIDFRELNKSREAALNQLSFDTARGVVQSAVSFQFPSGSVYVGDRVIESGGRIMNTKSETVGDLNAVLTQRYNAGNYFKAQVFDETQTLTPISVQVADDADNPGVEEININYIAQENIHIQSISFKPYGGTITKDFTVEFRFDILDQPVYSQVVDYTTVTDFGGGLFGFNINHPALFDLADIIHITFKDIELLGGNGYDGTDGIRQGDVDYSYFFPFLRFGAIPIVYQNLATENYVDAAVLDYVEISSDVTLNKTKHYIVDTTSGEVDINIPYGVTSSFTVRDGAKTFDVNSCFIRIFDNSAIPVEIHTAELNVVDTGYIFYFDGTNWKYGIIGQGEVIAIASTHCAASDFNPDCVNISAQLTDNTDISETEQIITFNDIKRANNTSYSSGVFTVKKGYYNGDVVLHVNVASETDIILWTEYRTVGDTEWKFYGYGMLKQKIANNSNVSYIFNCGLNFINRTEFRVKVKSSQDCTLKVQLIESDLGFVSQPAVSIDLKKTSWSQAEYDGISYTDWYNSIVTAADIMLGVQNDDGSFDWINDDDPENVGSANIQGATARGIIRAYQITNDTRYLDSVNDVADWIVNNAPDTNINKNIIFLFELAAAGGNDHTTMAKSNAINHINEMVVEYGGTGAEAMRTKYLELDWTCGPGVLNGDKFWMIGEWGHVASLIGSDEIYTDYTGQQMANELGGLLATDYLSYDFKTDNHGDLGLVGIVEGMKFGDWSTYADRNQILEDLYGIKTVGWQDNGYKEYALSLFGLGKPDQLSRWINAGYFVLEGTTDTVESRGEALLGAASNIINED